MRASVKPLQRRMSVWWIGGLKTNKRGGIRSSAVLDMINSTLD